MRVAMLAPIAWRVPPRHYGPWERVVSLLTEGLVKKGIDVTLFATADSITSAHLHPTAPRGYEEDKNLDAKVWEVMHISEVFEHSEEFDIIHNHFDFPPLGYSKLTTTPVVTTIHGFSSSRILPVYKKYDGYVYYVSISYADRSPEINYIANVYHGIDVENFPFNDKPDDYLVCFGRIHPDKGQKEAIEIARKLGMKLVLAGIIHDVDYYKKYVEPEVDGTNIVYMGSVGPEARNEILSKAKALLHTIGFDEPFGLSVVEAMATGTPVVAFNRGSMPEIIVDGEVGFLVDGVDEAVEAVRRIGEIDRRKCREHVEKNFSQEKMVDGYIEVYKKILEERKREDHRPWGYYQVLSDEKPDHKVKRIVVYPGQRLSLQLHHKRSEHWFIVKGEGVVTLGDRQIPVKAGDDVNIPVETPHRIQNTGKEDLVFIEVQTGSYFGEDDIVRLQDDYGRT